MTEIIKPFRITETRQDPDGALGVTFEAWKAIVLSESKRRKIVMTAFVRVPAGEDVDMTVFIYLQESGWL